MPTLRLLVGLPGVGKTTLARQLTASGEGIRLSPDEWMLPLFGASNPAEMRDVLEGRLLSLGIQALAAGIDVVVDFGLWGRDERTSLRAIAAELGVRCEVSWLNPGEDRRREWIEQRYARAPHATFEMSPAAIDSHLDLFQPPTADELTSGPLDPVTAGMPSWLAWADARWPSLDAVEQLAQFSRRC